MTHDTPVIKATDAVPAEEVERCVDTTIQVLLGPDEVSCFYTRQFTIAPGGSIPAHRHDSIEHDQVMLAGEMVLTLAGQERTVTTGDVVYIPAGTAHAYRNDGDEPVRFLCIVPATAVYGTEWLDG